MADADAAGCRLLPQHRDFALGDAREICAFFLEVIRRGNFQRPLLLPTEADHVLETAPNPPEVQADRHGVVVGSSISMKACWRAHSMGSGKSNENPGSPGEA